MSGALKREPMRFTSTRCPISSVGTIDSDGIRYGLTRKAWMPSARPSATATMTTSSMRELPVDLSFLRELAIRPSASSLGVGGGRVAGGGGLGLGSGLRRRHLDTLDRGVDDDGLLGRGPGGVDGAVAQGGLRLQLRGRVVQQPGL